MLSEKKGKFLHDLGIDKTQKAHNHKGEKNIDHIKNKVLCSPKSP